MINKLTVSLKSKLYISVLIAVISLLIAAGGYLFYKQQANALRQEKYNELKAIADLKVSQIENWLDERNADAKIVAQSPFFIDGVYRWIQDTGNVRLKGDIIERLKPVQKEMGYESIFLAKTNGHLLFSITAGLEEFDILTKQKISEASLKKEILFTDFYFCQKENKIHYDIIAPIIYNENKTIAVLILRRHPNYFLYPLIQDWPTPSKSAETAILRVEKDSVIFLNELRHRKNTALKLKVPLSRTEGPAVQAALGRTGLFEGIDYRGVEVLSDIRIIPDTNWIMLSKVDKSEIYADLNLTAGIITGFTILLVIICALGFVYIYTSRQKNIFKELFIKEKELYKQREQFEITLNNLGDGVMALDTKGNIQYMNNRAEELTGWKLKEARGKDFHDVYNVINEETGLAENNILDKVIKHGIVKELGNHTILISKSGKKIPVMDTGAPVFDTDGTLTGIAIAFQDETEKRHQQKLIKESESRLRSAFDNMLEGCQIIGHDWRYLYINNVAEINNRRPKTELLGNKYMDMWPGIETTEVFRIIKRCMEERIAHQMNNEFTFPDGTEGWFKLNIEPVPEGILILTEDITEQKLAEEKLRESNERFNRLVTSLDDVVWTSTPDGSTLLDVNDSFEKVYGISLDQFKANPELWNEMVHPDDRQIAEASGKELFEKGKAEAEYRIVKPDGTIVWLMDRKSLIYDTNGKVVQMGGIAKDITERKQNENFLVTQRNLGITSSAITNLGELYRVSTESLFNVSGMECGMIYLFDGEQKKLDMVCSEGLSEQFVSVTSHYDEHSDNVKFVKLGKPAFVNYNELPVELSEIERAEKLVSVAILPIVNKGKVIGCINLASHRSISMPVSVQKSIEVIVTLISNAIVRINAEDEIKNLNASLEIKIEERTGQLAKAKTEAERANVAKSEFLSRMSHELRTPMNSILGFAQLLNRSETNPERKKRINQIMNSGMHLLDLINEVLDLARIESGKLSLSLEPVQLSGIIMESLDIVHPIAEERDIKIELADSPVNNLFVKSDRQKLKQVMLNLINNAVKFTHKGGEVEVGITQTGHSIRISVRDTGIGIAPEEIHKLFEPFQRIGSEISEVEGTGLGLAVAKKLVEALNGIIGVESVVGVGSTFWIELPLTESQLEHNVQTCQSAKPETAITPGSGTILYIEDNISNIQLVEDILRTERPNIRLVAEMYGKNVVKTATDYKPDLILLDLDLPDIHGSKVLKLLQIDSATKSIPVVVLSADAMTHMIEQLMAAGAKYYLTQPPDVVEFLEVVDELLNKGGKKHD